MQVSASKENTRVSKFILTRYHAWLRFLFIQCFSLFVQCYFVLFCFSSAGSCDICVPDIRLCQRKLNFRKSSKFENLLTLRRVPIYLRFYFQQEILKSLSFCKPVRRKMNCVCAIAFIKECSYHGCPTKKSFQLKPPTTARNTKYLQRQVMYTTYIKYWNIGACKYYRD